MISVVVPTYNEEKNIEECLRSIIDQTLPRGDIDIIVVDGDSKDRTREIAEQLADTFIIQTSEGVGGARNDGFAVARGEIVATTDADCRPHPDWLEVIQRRFRDPEIVAVTGVLIPFDFGEMGGLEELAYRLLFDLSNAALVTMSWLGKLHLCGANSAFRRDAFLEAGGYLPLAYADDVEIYKRIKTKGKVRLDTGMRIRYSVRRIKKVGLLRYVLLLFKMEWDVMVMGRKPVKGGYARQTYG
ncbi:MAG TPA: glycosyltransferase family 2 protein [Candidatus Bathyarchaeia archaeon]